MRAKPLSSKAKRTKRTPSASKKTPSASKKTPTALAAKIVQDVWPQERDFFERPDRYKYVRKLVKTTGCVFCEAVKQPDAMILAKDPDVIVLMNKYPYNTGHLLVVPRKHLGDLMQLDDAVHARVGWWIKRAMGALTEALNCHGFNVGLNHGKVAGAGIPDHLHWHVIPRWGGDTNFFPLIAETKVLPETLAQTYTRLKPLFKGLG